MRPYAALAAVCLTACHQAPPHTGTAAGDLPFSDAEVYAGDSLYHFASSCAQCHGSDAAGTANGPSLRGPVWRHTNGGSYPDLVRIINNGVPTQQIMDRAYRMPMPIRGGVPVLSSADIRAIAAYIYTISRR